MDETVKILILEDDEQLRNVLCQVLTGEGHEVTAASRAEGAIHAARECAFDLVVADIRMEGKSGLDALEEIKTEQPDMRSLVITGYSTEADSIRAIQLGVNDYLTKPFKLDKFLDSINGIIARHRIEKARQRERDTVRSSLLWITRLAGVLCDRQESSPGLQTLDQEAVSLSDKLGMTTAQAEQIRLAALWCALRSSDDVTLPDEAPALPKWLQRILDSVEERWDGSGQPNGLMGRDIPLESRTVAVLLAAHRGELKRRVKKGKYDPEILSLREGENRQARDREELQPSQRRSLLSLGRALQESGQREGARQAFETLAAGSLANREQAEALVSLAQLSGQFDFAERAVTVAESLGPTLAGNLLLRATLATESHPKSLAWLKRAGSIFKETGDQASQAITALAMDKHSAGLSSDLLEHSAELLLRPEHRNRLVEATTWLLPHILKKAQLQEAEERLAQRILWDAQSIFGSFLESHQLEVNQRQRLLDLVTKAGHSPSEPIKQYFLGDADPSIKQQAQAFLSRDAQENISTFLRARILGPFEVQVGDRRVQESDWKTRKVKFLAAWLFARTDQTLSEDRVLDQFWPDELEKGKQSLYWATSAIRRVLKGEKNTACDPILRHLGTLSLNPETPQWVDIDELNAINRKARRQLAGAENLKISAFRPLVELYRGPFLEECYMDWAADFRTRLSRETAETLEGLARYAEREEDYESASDFTEKLVEIDPWNQEMQALHFRSLLNTGRPDRVMRQYESLEQALRLELDVDPNMELVELYHRAKIML